MIKEVWGYLPELCEEFDTQSEVIKEIYGYVPAHGKYMLSYFFFYVEYKGNFYRIQGDAGKVVSISKEDEYKNYVISKASNLGITYKKYNLFTMPEYIRKIILSEDFLRRLK